jgi:hypothetical protein
MAYAPDTQFMGGGGEGYPEPGTPMDHLDHPDMDLPEPGHSPRMKHNTQMAGDVLPFPKEGPDLPFGDPKAIGYAVGKNTDVKVHSIGMDKLKSWASSLGNRKND